MTLGTQPKKKKAQSLETGRIEPIKWVFHRDGEKVAGINKVWKEATKQAGCPDLLLHDFRRAAVRNLDRAGVPQTVAMKITGHKTASVYRRYNIVNHKDLQNAAAALEAAEASVTVLSQLDKTPAVASR